MSKTNLSPSSDPKSNYYKKAFRKTPNSGKIRQKRKMGRRLKSKGQGKMKAPSSKQANSYKMKTLSQILDQSKLNNQ